MAARDAAVAPMRKEIVAPTRGALGRSADRPLGEPRFEKRDRDGEREVERDPGGMRPESLLGKAARDLAPDGIAAGVNAGTDRDAEVGGRNAARDEEPRGSSRDLLPRAAPSGVDDRSERTVPRDERDGGAVGGRDGHPGIAGPEEKSIRLARRIARRHDPAPVDLMDPNRPFRGDTERVEQERAVPEHGLAHVADLEPEVERRKRAFAHAAAARGHAEPDARREVPLRRSPDREAVGPFRLGHAAQVARSRLRTQAGCVPALRAAGVAAGLAAGIAATLAAGCARVPVAGSGVEARARLLAAHASDSQPTRGVGSVSLRRPGQRRGGARARWAADSESVAVVGYLGPARVFDAALKGDSLYLALRHDELGVAGPLRADEGFSGQLLRFVATPWDLSAPWVRAALERSAVEPSGKGWVCRGTLSPDDRAVGVDGADGDPTPEAAGERYRFALEVTSKGAPSRCTLRREGEERDLISIRYGPERRFQAGRVPSWIEWSFSGSVVRLSLEDLSPIDGGRIRYPAPADPEWTMLTLDEPRGRALVRWLLGIPEEGARP